MQRSKTYRAAADSFDKDELYAPLTAIKIAKTASKKKFDETVDVVMRLGVDPRKADQMVRGTVNLPHGTGKTARVLVFANADKAEAAREAGADIVGGDELIDKVAGGWLDFDAVVATPDMMGKVGRLGRVLGPRGLMPNPKTGTVTPDVAKAVTDIKGGKIEFRVDRHANLHFIIGKASFGEVQLAENYAAALEEVLRLKPASSKGRYIKKVTVSTTMPPANQRAPNPPRNGPVVHYNAGAAPPPPPPPGGPPPPPAPPGGGRRHFRGVRGVPDVPRVAGLAPSTVVGPIWPIPTSAVLFSTNPRPPVVLPLTWCDRRFREAADGLRRYGARSSSRRHPALSLRSGRSSFRGPSGGRPPEGDPWRGQTSRRPSRRSLSPSTSPPVPC